MSIMSIRLSMFHPPSGSISFSLAKTGRVREPAATLPRASVDGAEKAREEEARDNMAMVWCRDQVQSGSEVSWKRLIKRMARPTPPRITRHPRGTR